MITTKHKGLKIGRRQNQDSNWKKMKCVTGSTRARENVVGATKSVVSESTVSVIVPYISFLNENVVY